MKPVFVSRSPDLLREPGLAATGTVSHRDTSVKRREVGKGWRVADCLRWIKSICGRTNCRRCQAHVRRGATRWPQAVDNGRRDADSRRQLSYGIGYRIGVDLGIWGAIWRPHRGRRNRGRWAGPRPSDDGSWPPSLRTSPLVPVLVFPQGLFWLNSGSRRRHVRQACWPEDGRWARHGRDCCSTHWGIEIRYRRLREAHVCVVRIGGGCRRHALVQMVNGEWCKPDSSSGTGARAALALRA